jgi:molybdenum cofactor synthesis domain-containing protein
VRAAVLTISSSLARGDGEDVSGPELVACCERAGLQVTHETVSDDRDAIAAALRRLADDEDVRFVFTTGGTGLTPTDRTPEATAALLDREVPGIAEAIRAAGVSAGVPTAMLSRGLAGMVGDCLVVNLPGSRGGVKDGLAVLGPVLRHAVEQAVGSDH